jgi:dTDP-D-glucose 4,6-dehydratase
MTLYRNQRRRANFQEGARDKMPLVIFGDGTHNKDHLHFRGHMHGVTDEIYKNLQRREKNGELLLLDINESRTLVVSVAVYI